MKCGRSPQGCLLPSGAPPPAGACLSVCDFWCPRASPHLPASVWGSYLPASLNLPTSVLGKKPTSGSPSVFFSLDTPLPFRDFNPWVRACAPGSCVTAGPCECVSLAEDQSASVGLWLERVASSGRAGPGGRGEDSALSGCGCPGAQSPRACASAWAVDGKRPAGRVHCFMLSQGCEINKYLLNGVCVPVSALPHGSWRDPPPPLQRPKG